MTIVKRETGELDRLQGNRGSFLLQRDPRFLLFGLSGQDTSWRGVTFLAIAFFGSLAAAAALTPLAYALLEVWQAQTGSATAAAFLQKGEVRFFSGIRWIVILLCLPWLFVACRIRSLEAVGLRMDGAELRRWLLWFLIGSGLIIGLAIAQITFGAALSRASTVRLEREIPIRLLQSVVGALGEEVIFRGLILRVFYAATRRPWLALVLTSAFFAYTHFKVPESAWGGLGDRSTIGWFIAYWTLTGITVDFDLIRFSSLFLLGVALGALALRTGSVWPAAGLHAGLVMGILMFKGHYDPPPGPTSTLWGGPGFIDGWATSAALTVLIIGLVLSGRRRA